MRDEDHPIADLALAELGTGSAVVPPIWWYEMRNSLVLNERRGRISFADCIQFLRELNHLQIEVAGLGDGDEVMDLSRKHGLSVYDAAYLALAIREELPLASLDRPLQAAARSAGVEILA